MQSCCKLVPILLITAFFKLSANSNAEPAAVIAVWDPECGTTESRADVDPSTAHYIAEKMHQPGTEVFTASAGEIAGGILDTRNADALVFAGNGFPESLIAPIMQFSDRGGIVVSLGAEVPFLIKLDRKDDGWRLSPQTPMYAWQTDAVMKHLGSVYKYDPSRHDQGVYHRPSRFFKQWASGIPELDGQLESRWVVPMDGAEYCPLIHSFRADGIEIPGPLYLIRCRGRVSIFCTSRIFVFDTDKDVWTNSEDVLAGISELIKALSSGNNPLESGEMFTKIDMTAPPARHMPLVRYATGEADPDGAIPLKRWGKFNGSCLELKPCEKNVSSTLPQYLDPGASCLMPLSDITSKIPENAPLFLRIRGAFSETGAGLKVEAGGHLLWNETLKYIDTREPGNFSVSLSGYPEEFNRIIFLPKSFISGTNVFVRISNPGIKRIVFDAVQAEVQPNPPARCIGLGAGQYQGNNYPLSESARWGGLRKSLRTQFIGPPGANGRFSKFENLLNEVIDKGTHIQPILEGTPEWAPVSQERYAEGVTLHRPSTVPPDVEKYAAITGEIIDKYGELFDIYEIWNEPDITQFFRGTADEYARLFKAVARVIREKDPTAKVMSGGMAGYRPEFIREMLANGVFREADIIAFHPYAGKSASWNLPYGLVQGMLFSRGCSKEIFCNESGFPSDNGEWKSPPEMTQEAQKQRLDVAMGRILASGVAKLSVFHAGGDDHSFGLFNKNGSPKPAYSVFSDYAFLNGPGAVKTDIAMRRTDGSPICGIYTAASRKKDGVCTVVINPSECSELSPVKKTDLLSDETGKWIHFFCSVEHSRGKSVKIVPEAGKTAGFYKKIMISKTGDPSINVTFSGERPLWGLMFKLPDGRIVDAVPKRGAGSISLRLAEILPEDAFQSEIEISFRVYSGIGEITNLSLTPSPTYVLKSQQIILSIPADDKCKGIAEAHTADGPVPVKTVLHEDRLDITIDLQERTVLRVR